MKTDGQGYYEAELAAHRLCPEYYECYSRQIKLKCIVPNIIWTLFDMRSF